MKVFAALDRQRLSEQVARELENMIVGGTVGVGSRLPSEQALATQFVVSRNVIREAFVILQERGLVISRTGSGAYVAAPQPEVASHALGRYLRLVDRKLSLRNLYEARNELEVANVRLAAQRADAGDLATMRQMLERMAQHTDSIEQWVESDLAFHLAIAVATHNPLFRILLEPLVDQLREVIVEGFVISGAIDTGLSAHRRLYAAIEAHQPEDAIAALVEHLRDSEARAKAFLVEDA